MGDRPDVGRDDLLPAVVDALGTAVTPTGSLGGGSISSVFAARTADGRDIVVKHNPAPPPGMFTSEARGLAWIGAVDDGPRVPAVYAAVDAGPGFIAMELIAPGPVGPDGDEAFGRALAALHRAGAPTFGLDHDNLLATIAQDNAPRRRGPRSWASAAWHPGRDSPSTPVGCPPASHASWTASLRDCRIWSARTSLPRACMATCGRVTPCATTPAARW